MIRFDLIWFKWQRGPAILGSHVNWEERLKFSQLRNGTTSGWRTHIRNAMQYVSVWSLSWYIYYYRIVKREKERKRHVVQLFWGSQEIQKKFANCSSNCNFTLHIAISWSRVPLINLRALETFFCRGEISFQIGISHTGIGATLRSSASLSTV